MGGMNVPSYWNGKPTEYHLFDGFNQSGILGKIAYVVGGLLLPVPPLVPILMEFRASSKAARNSRAAQEALSMEENLAHTRPMSGQDMEIASPQFQGMSPNKPQGYGR